MKKITIFSIVLAFLFMLLSVVSAEGATGLQDNADLIYASDETRLESAITELENKHNIDIIILLDKALFEGYEDTSALTRAMKKYCESYYESALGSRDGIMLLISLDDGYKDYYFYTFGKCHDIINDQSGMDYVENNVQPIIKQGRFFDACMKYLEVSEYVLDNPEEFNGDYELDYDSSYVSDYSEPWYSKIPYVAVGSLVIALIAVLIMKAQLRSVKPQSDASAYTVKDSFFLRSQSDIFLFRNVTKTAKPKDTSSSSSGRSGGGGGGGGRGGRC